MHHIFLLLKLRQYYFWLFPWHLSPPYKGPGMTYLCLEGPRAEQRELGAVKSQPSLVFGQIALPLWFESFLLDGKGRIAGRWWWGGVLFCEH